MTCDYVVDSIILFYFRAAFLDALVELVDPNITHFNKRCTSISKSSTRSTVHFSDGSTHEADVIIGADGIKSIVRGSVVADKRLAFTNTIAYRGLVSAQELRNAGFKTDASVRPINFVGIDKVRMSHVRTRKCSGDS